MPKLAICTESETNLFYLATGLILSLRRILPLYDAEIFFFSISAARQLNWLGLNPEPTNC
jgi:hypothetical protein